MYENDGEGSHGADGRDWGMRMVMILPEGLVSSTFALDSLGLVCTRPDGVRRAGRHGEGLVGCLGGEAPLIRSFRRRSG